MITEPFERRETSLGWPGKLYADEAYDLPKPRR